MSNFQMDDRVKSAIGAVAAVFVGALVLAGPVAAQEMQQQQQEIPELDEQELRTFAEAHLDVQEIRTEIQTSMQQAESPEEAQALQQEANEKMLAAIEDHDLTVERYSQIVNGINADAELEQRFTAMVEELTEDEERDGMI